MVSSIPENLSRQEYVYLAKLAEQTERYKEMAWFMQKLVVISTPQSELTVEERHLLSVACKNVIGPLRAAWRTISSIEQKEETKKNEEHAALAQDYRSKQVESEISEVCAGILKLLDSNLLPSATTSESKVFYLKMKGDCYRYLAEFKVGAERRVASEDAMLTYKEAQIIACLDLPSTHPVRLGIGLNLSVFYYEIMKQSGKACGMAQQVFDEAIAEMELGEESYKDSVVILQRLGKNLTLWNSDVQKQLHESRY